MKRKIKLFCIIGMLCLMISCSKKNADAQDLESITLSITIIRDDFFIGVPTRPSGDRYKVYAELDEEFCVGDYVNVYYEEMKESEVYDYEITAKLVEESDYELEPGVEYKPVIYLYPEEKTEVSVSLNYSGTLTHTYPLYADGWKVTAYPDGTLIDQSNREYPYLFWEGISGVEYDMSKGFCIKGSETEAFLMDKLSFMGLNRKETEDFIEFWVPFMEENPYNKISFQGSLYTESARLMVTPKPDSMLRVYMVYQSLTEYVEMEEQILTEFERTGFAVVEWGGSIIK